MRRHDREGVLLPLRSVCQTCSNVILGEIRKISDNLLERHAGGKPSQHIRDSDPQTTYARMSATLARLHCYDAILTHTSRPPWRKMVQSRQPEIQDQFFTSGMKRPHAQANERQSITALGTAEARLGRPFCSKSASLCFALEPSWAPSPPRAGRPEDPRTKALR